MSGCTAVFKVFELSPSTHHALLEALEEAGLPKEVLNIMQAKREDGAAVTEALITHRDRRKTEFIGSRAIGRAIGQTAAKHLKLVLMELDGKVGKSGCQGFVMTDIFRDSRLLLS